MRFLVLILTIFVTSAKAACLSMAPVIPSADDRAFYDRVIVSVVRESSWYHENAKQVAWAVISRRRAAFFAPQSTFNDGRLIDGEADLWMAVLTSAMDRGVQSIYTQRYIVPQDIANIAHDQAWGAMLARRRELLNLCP